LSGIPADAFLKVLGYNALVITKHAFCASVGILLFIRYARFNPTHDWEDWPQYFKTLPKMLLPALVLANVGYSGLIFHLFDVIPGGVARNSWQYLDELAVGVLGSVSEELLIRAYLMGALLSFFGKFKYRWSIAILGSALVWSLLHLGNYDSEWYKVAQVFPFGVVYGIVMKKYGLEVCIALHLLSNLMIISVFSIFSF
jgi:membrane protease YdiL (CAAX protease family)